MDKKKVIIALSVVSLSAAAAAVGGTSSPVTAFDAVWGAARQTAFLSAGVTLPKDSAEQTGEWTVEAEPPRLSQESEEPVQTQLTREQEESSQTLFTQSGEVSTEVISQDIADITQELDEITLEAYAEPEDPSEEPEPRRSAAQVISRNITPCDDGLDYTAAGTQSGAIYRRNFSGYQGTDYITLPGGGLVWNCTNESPEVIENAGGRLPELRIELNSPLPQVLIVHTHTTESFEPYQRSYFDSSFPYRSVDPEHNMTRVGEALAQRLAEQGISVLHDGTAHDYPAYTGAYDRSEETIRAALEEYPSIKVVIDLHRDAVISEDGSRTAPVAEINGRSAAQFMIISGCDDGRFGNMPHYEENLSLACLIQDSAESLYPGLSRPVLFDYRNYNQHITTGSLLIEVGSHANSLDEAVYTGELLGDCMAKALKQLS